MKTDGRLGFSCRSYLSWFCPEHRPFPPIHNISYRHTISDTLINLTYVAKSFPTTHFGLHVSYLLWSVGKVSRIPTPGDPKLAPFVQRLGLLVSCFLVVFIYGLKLPPLTPTHLSDWSQTFCIIISYLEPISYSIYLFCSAWLIVFAPISFRIYPQLLLRPPKAWPMS
jgi:hypothetical protein